MVDLEKIFKQVDSVSRNPKFHTSLVVCAIFNGDRAEKDVDFVVVGSGLEFVNNLMKRLKKGAWWNFLILIPLGI